MGLDRRTLENRGGDMLSYIFIATGTLAVVLTFALEGKYKWKDWVYTLMTIIGILCLCVAYCIKFGG